MLQSETLFFTRADQLREFDKFEGEYQTEYLRNIGDAILQELSSSPNQPTVCHGKKWLRWTK